MENIQVPKGALFFAHTSRVIPQAKPMEVPQLHLPLPTRWATTALVVRPYAAAMHAEGAPCAKQEAK